MLGEVATPMSTLKDGTVIRYVGAQKPRFAGMEGFVTKLEGEGAFALVTVRFSPFAESDTHVVCAHELRPLSKFSTPFAKKYPTPTFENLPTFGEES